MKLKIIFIYDCLKVEVKKLKDQEIIEITTHTVHLAMTTVQLKCPMGAATCDYMTEEVETMTIAMQLLEMHARLAHPPQQAQVPAAQAKTGKIIRPKLELKDSFVDEETFAFFEHRWSEYKGMAGVEDNMAKKELSHCLSDEVQMLMFGRYGKEQYEALTEPLLITAVKEMVVRTRNKMVTRHKLRKMVQSHDQPIQTFLSNLKATARLCDYKVKCEEELCGKFVDFTDQMVMEQLTVGLADEETQRKLFMKPDISLKEAEKLVIAEETGKLSQEDSRSVAALSLYQRQKKEAAGGGKKCKFCGGTTHSEEEGDSFHVRKKHCPAFGKKCEKCSRMGHYTRLCKSNPRDPKAEPKEGKVKSESASGVDEHMLEINLGGGGHAPTEYPALGQESVNQLVRNNQEKLGSAKRRILRHMRFDVKAGKYVSTWTDKRMKVLQVGVSVDREQYQELSGIKSPEEDHQPKVAKQSGVADTGASVCCSGTDVLHSMGVTQQDLLQTDVCLYAANRKKLTILGMLPVIVSSKRVGTGELVETRQFLYIVEELGKLYVSREALQALGSVPLCFPEVPAQHVSAMEYAEELIAKIAELETRAPCGCPVRSAPPESVSLPCPATEENRSRLKEFLVASFQSSTFNTCEHQPLPLMHGPPLEFKMKEGSEPFAIYTPAKVPAHWHDKVEADIKRDVALGVLEEVPENTGMTWCHRMVICRKHNGDPRRTIDLQPLNAASIRQCHPTQPPLEQAHTVPHNQKKTVVDCWNGYHSVAIREEDRHLTTFYTPWGRYRYKTCPQGYNTSGDAYTHRYDKIVMGVKNMRRVIDDTLLYEDNIEKAFHQVAEYLTLVGKNGIILNPDKFQFAADTVDWAGVRLTAEKVEPLPAHVKAIREYPAPRNITDMRSYFALVNQVSPFYATQPELLPFRELLKKNSVFYWDGVLQKLFDESKNKIADKVLEGITRFEVGRWTGLLTDWCKQGLGYLLVQKHCGCEELTPICCSGVWRVCMVGSRFTSAAEQNYSPVEGEMLAVADGLYKTRFYTQGCEKLIVGVDHKPLLGLLNGKPLDQIDNGRLLRLKEKTLGWRFKMIHIPGKRNGGPDALSRAVPQSHDDPQSGELACHLYDDGSAGDEEQQRVQARREVLAAIRSVLDPAFTTPTVEMDVSNELLASMSLEVKSIEWDMVKKETEKDESSKSLVQWISTGCPGPIDQLHEKLRDFWRVRESLRLVDGVAMYGDRTVIPEKLRPDVLVVLHSAHQGVTGMNLRAEKSVFWPGITKDISAVRERCFTCHKNAPSQAKLPPVVPIVPQYPFEHICTDYMSLHGHNYGVFVDRFTGWPGVYIGGAASDVVTVLSKICEDYGVPRTCTTDGGPPYTSEKVKKMMATYGIGHRLCSVGNPHANCRAELAVKSVKRMLRDNITMTGNLDRVKFSRALLTYRNTPDRDTGMSPAMALFNRQLRDFLPTAPLVGSMWQEIADAREKALAPRSTMQHEKWSIGVKELLPLQVGDNVFVQNQSGNYPRKWDKRGRVVEVKGFDQYVVMVDGSRRVTLRNRKYLRKYTPFQCKPFSATPVLRNVIPVGNEVEEQPLPQVRGANVSPAAAPEVRHDVHEHAVGRGGHAPNHAVPAGQVANHSVGGGHAPPPATYSQVAATPVGGGHAAHQPHQAVSMPPLGPSSTQQITQDQVDRSSGPVMDMRDSVQPATEVQIKQDPASKDIDLKVRRSARANKGKTSKYYEDFEMEL